MTLGETLKELLEQHHITQKQLAKELHISPSALGNYVQNTREPDYKTLIKIADYFQVTIDFLLNHSQPNKLTHNEELLLNIFRTLPTEQQELYIEQGKLFINFNKKYSL